MSSNISGVSKEPFSPEPISTTSKEMEKSSTKQMVSGAFTFSTDTIAPTPPQFSTTTFYDESPGHPTPPNPDLDGQLGSQPYGMAERNFIMKFFSKQALDLIAKQSLTPAEAQTIYDALISGKPIVNPKLAPIVKEIEKQATEATRKQNGLPESWTLRSTLPKDWTPIITGAIDPTMINKMQGELILENVGKILLNLEKAGQNLRGRLSPNDPDLLTMGQFTETIAKGLRKLQEVLRETQLKDAEKSQEAVKSKRDAIKAREGDLQRSIEKREEIAQKQKDAQKFSDTMKVVGPIISVVATVVGAALAIFTFGLSTALIVAGIAIGAAMAAYSVVDSYTGCTQKFVQFVNETIEKHFPNDPVAQKIVKAIAVAVVVAILITMIVLSGRLEAATLVVQIIKESIALLAVQVIIIVVMASNAIPELFGAILKASGMNEQDSKIAEIILMIITMIAVLIATATGKGGAAPKGIGEGIKDMANGIKDMALKTVDLMKNLFDSIKKGFTEASSNAIKALQSNIKQMMTALNKLGDMIKDPQFKADILARIARVKEAGAELLELLKHPARLKEVALNQLKAVSEKFSQAVDDLLKALATARVQARETASEGFKHALNRVSELTDKALKDLATIPGEVGKKFKEVGKGFVEIWKGIKGIKEGIHMTEAQKMAGLRSTKAVLELSKHTTEIMDGVNRGIMGIQVHDLLLEVGKIKESEELLQAVIQMTNKLLENIESGIDMRSEFITSLQQAYNHFLDAIRRDTSTITQSRA